MIVAAFALTPVVGEFVGVGLLLVLMGAALRLVLAPVVRGWRALGRVGQVGCVVALGLLLLGWLLSGPAPRPAPPPAPAPAPSTVTVATRGG